MKLLPRISLVCAIALFIAAPARADFAGTVTGRGMSAAGISFSMLVNGFDDLSASGSMAVGFVGSERFVVAQARCIVVVDNAALVVGSVVSSSDPVSGDVAFALTDGAVDEFGWGIVPRLSCVDWLSPPPMETTMLSSPLTQGSLSIEFRSPAERLADMIGELQTGTANASSFVAKLQSASASMAAGNAEATCNKLDAFANEVRAQTGKKLSQADADALLRETAAIKTKVGCP
jgi:hypothetical protein